MTDVIWHGWHRGLRSPHCRFETSRRLGSIKAEADPSQLMGHHPPELIPLGYLGVGLVSYLAAGEEHLPRRFPLFAEAKDYLDGPPTRERVESQVWSDELYGPARIPGTESV